MFCRGRTQATRIHLVLGFAPWFDYIAAEEAWIANEFFGRLHPFDMVAEGLLNPGIRAAASSPPVARSAMGGVAARSADGEVP